MSKKTILKVGNLDAFYGSLQVMWDISIEIKIGEIVAIIGANGSGKSTLLNAISGFVQFANGNILFKGKDITALNPFQIVSLGISQVPEGRRVFPDLSVLDNLILGSYNRNARPKKMQNLEMVYNLFPILAERKGQLAKNLSGGEQQMLVLGRGLMSDTELMLIDEMSLGLAPIVLDQVYRVLRKIRKEGITILFVEQNVKRSLEEADRAYIMEVGRIVLSGDVADLRENDEVKKAYFGV